jgi:hypothetical protein
MSQTLSIKAKDGGVVLRLRVQPKSSRNDFSVDAEGQFRLAITAPPVDGQANKAVLQVLAKTLGVPKRAVQLISGDTSRNKTVFIENIDCNSVASAFNKSNQPS